MIVEVGLFGIEPSRVEAFAPIAEDIRRAFAPGIAGLRSFHMANALEDPGRWVVLAAWDSVDDHARFVASDEGWRQRALLERYMVDDPEVFHVDLDDVSEGLR
jgi:heme-degrading monooxygenase HmoA